MRRAALSALLLGGVPLLVGPAVASAGTGQGRYLTPFREDGARYVAATNTFVGGHRGGAPTDANGCVTAPARTGAPPGNAAAYDCLPAGASMVALPGGRVLFWNALEGEEQVTGLNAGVTDGGRYLVNDESRLLDPRGPTWAVPAKQDGGVHQTTHPDDLPLGPFSAQHYAYDNGSLFCSDQVLLGNGDVLDTGGTDYYTEPYVPVVNKGVIELEGVRNSRYFDVRTDSWHVGPTMHYGRWYPSLVTLGNGQVFVASGVTKLIKPVYPTRPTESGTNVTRTEILTVGSRHPHWVLNPSTADRSLPLFPRLHLLPDGHVYYDAAGQAFNPAGQAYDEATWYEAASYDPKSRTWADLGLPGSDSAYLAAHPDAALFAGFRGSTFSAALTLRPSRVLGGVPTYGSASYLTAGGVVGTSPGSYFPVANSRIDTVNTAGGADKLTTVGTGDLGTARWYGTATPLPNGQVFLSSGASADEVLAPGSESPIRADELFTPTVDASGRYTGGTWAPAGTQARKRTYHNNALLLPDGSVLIGGHAPIVTGYYQTTDSPDLPMRDGTNNHHDASFQVWQPQYFSDPARPVIDGVVASGRTLTVSTAQASKVATVVLMRNTAQTHLVDGDGRTVSLPVLSRTADSVTVGLPSTTNVLPNGPYLLFVNASKTGDLSGRDAANLLPSRARQVVVTGTSVPIVLAPTRGARPHPSHGNGHGHKGKGPHPRPGTPPAAQPVTVPQLALTGGRPVRGAGVPLALVLGAGALVAVGARRFRASRGRRA